MYLKVGKKGEKTMNIKNLKQHIITGPEDGQTIAFIKNQDVYLVQADGMSDALIRLQKMGIANTGDWMLSNDKAVLIPGVWEYQQAVYIGDMNQDQIDELAQQLREAA